jgi:hypothetical protein
MDDRRAQDAAVVDRITSPLTDGGDLRKRGLLGFLWVGWRAELVWLA